MGFCIRSPISRSQTRSQPVLLSAIPSPQPSRPLLALLACMHAHACRHTGIQAYRHTGIQAYMHTCIYIYIYIYTHRGNSRKSARRHGERARSAAHEEGIAAAVVLRSLRRIGSHHRMNNDNNDDNNDNANNHPNNNNSNDKSNTSRRAAQSPSYRLPWP